MSGVREGAAAAAIAWRWLACAALVACVLFAWGGRAAAAGSLNEAQARFNAGEYDSVLRLAGPLLDDETLPRADRAEALRLYGLALYFQNRHDEADAALFEFLKLEPEARLDPTLVPPEGIAFFEGVRARHAGELAAYRPRPRRRGHVLVSLIPVAGQFQNGERGKGWALGVTEGLLLATHVTTYFMLVEACDKVTGVCEDEGVARSLRTVNIVAGVALVGVAIYGVADGYLGWKRREADFEGGGGGSLTIGVSTGVGVGAGAGAVAGTGAGFGLSVSGTF